ncbi:hypothetical protein DRN62_01720, partial [Nanoarchaeota archaeon]
KRIEERVSLTDLFPTILDVLGMDTPENIDGVSLLPLIKGDGGYDKEYVLSELWGRPLAGEYFQQAIYRGDWKLINVVPDNDVIPPSLFNLKEDPHEQENLYDINVEEREFLLHYLNNITGGKPPTTSTSVSNFLYYYYYQ